MADIDFAATGTTGTARFQQPVGAGDDGVHVGGGLPQAIGEFRHAWAGVFQAHFFAAASRIAPDAQHRSPRRIVAVGGDALIDQLPVAAAAADGNAGEMLRMIRIFVVVDSAHGTAGDAALGVGVGPGAAVVVGGNIDLDQIALRLPFPMLVFEAAHRCVDGHDAAKALRIVSRKIAVEIVKAQFATRRIDDPEQFAARSAGEAQEGAAGDADLLEAALRIEVELAAVGPFPGEFLASGGASDDHPSVGRIAAAA